MQYEPRFSTFLQPDPMPCQRCTTRHRLAILPVNRLMGVARNLFRRRTEVWVPSPVGSMQGQSPGWVWVKAPQKPPKYADSVIECHKFHIFSVAILEGTCPLCSPFPTPLNRLDYFNSIINPLAAFNLFRQEMSIS